MCVFHLCTCLDAFAPQGRSIRSLQRESGAAFEDGAVLPEVSLLGDLGCKGKWPQNVERDLERRVRRELRLPHSYMVETSWTKPDGTEDTDVVGIFFPMSSSQC